MYSNVTRDEGVESVRLTMTRTIPRILAVGGACCALIIEGYGAIRGGQFKYDETYGSRPFYFAIMGAALFLLCVGSSLPRKNNITAAAFPYLALGCGTLILTAIGVIIVTIVRYGSRTGSSPWDSQMRLLTATLLIFLPRTLHLLPSFAFPFNVLAVVSLEILLGHLYQLYGYNPKDYDLPSLTRGFSGYMTVRSVQSSPACS